jgi:hypothetical protein
MSEVEDVESNVHLESAGSGELLDDDPEAEDSEATDGEAEL